LGILDLAEEPMTDDPDREGMSRSLRNTLEIPASALQAVNTRDGENGFAAQRDDFQGPYSPVIPNLAKMSAELRNPLPEMTSMLDAFTLPSASGQRIDSVG